MIHEKGSPVATASASFWSDQQLNGSAPAQDEESTHPLLDAWYNKEYENMQFATDFFRKAGLERLLLKLREKYIELGVVGRSSTSSNKS